MAAEVEIVGNSKALAGLHSLSNGSGIFSTVAVTDEASKRKVLAAVMNAVPLQDHLGEQINMVDLVAQVVTINDSATDEQVDVVRTLILDKDGVAYHTTSDAIVASIRDMFAILGQPSEWKNPLGILVSREKGSRGSARQYFKVTLA